MREEKRLPFAGYFLSFFFTFDETMSYWILCSLRSTSDKIIVPNTQLVIKWFTQKTKTRKTLFFFICYYPSSRQPAGKVQSFGPEGWGYSEGGQIKTNFSLFCFVCICVCAKNFLAAWNNIAGCLFVCLFFLKCGCPGFFCWCNVSSLYFSHKLLNETAHLRSVDEKSRGGNYGLFCVPYGGE